MSGTICMRYEKASTLFLVSFKAQLAISHSGSTSLRLADKTAGQSPNARRTSGSVLEAEYESIGLAAKDRLITKCGIHRRCGEACRR